MDIKSLLKVIIPIFIIGLFGLTIGYGAGKFFESLEKEISDTNPVRIMAK